MYRELELIHEQMKKANFSESLYPELRAVMDVAGRMIVNLETWRHEALLLLALGNLAGVEEMLKLKVEVAESARFGYGMILKPLPNDSRYCLPKWRKTA